MKKKSLRARLETDMAALLSFLAAIAVFALLMVGIGLGAVAPIIVAVIWVGATFYTVIRINKLRKSMYTPNRSDGLQLFLVGAYLGWNLWVWPKVVDKIAPKGKRT